jgi:hypothetical protein
MTVIAGATILQLFYTKLEKKKNICAIGVRGCVINACCVKFKFKNLYKSINFWLISSLMERRPGDSTLSRRGPEFDSRREQCVCPRGVLFQGGENFGKVPQYMEW